MLAQTGCVCFLLSKKSKNSAQTRASVSVTKNQCSFLSLVTLVNRCVHASRKSGELEQMMSVTKKKPEDASYHFVTPVQNK